MLLCLMLAASSVGVLAEEAVASEMPTRIERLRGLAEVWGMVHLFHPALADPDAQAGWWAATREAISEVEAADTIEAYAKALQALVAKVGDQVTAIYLPDELANAAVPISLAYADGKTMIADVLEEAVDSDQSIIGWELVSVDGVDVAEHLNEWLPIASGETAELRRAWVYEKLLGAEVGAVVSLGLVDDGGIPIDVAVGIPSNDELVLNTDPVIAAPFGAEHAYVHVPSLHALVDLSSGRGIHSDLRHGELERVRWQASIAEGVVLDLRSGPSLFGEPIWASKVLPEVLSTFAPASGVLAQGFMQREHRGYAMDAGKGRSSAAYSTGWRVESGEPMAGGAASTTPLVVLVDAESHRVAGPYIQPLVDAGCAVVLGEAGTLPWSSDYSHTLPGGIKFSLRLSVPHALAVGSGLDLIAWNEVTSHESIVLAADELLKDWEERASLPVVERPSMAAELLSPSASSLVSTVISREECLLGLFKLWTVVKYFYPYQDLVTGDWPDLLETAIADVEAAVRTTSTAEYARSLQRLVVQLRDGHAFIQGGGWMTVFFPPGTIRPIGSQAVFAKPFLVFDSAGEPAWMPAGQIILEVFGFAVDEFLSRSLPLAWGATAAYREDMAHAMLFTGIAGDIELLLETDANEELLVEIPRDQFLMRHTIENPYERPEPEPFWKDEGVAYVDICSISADEFAEVEEQVLSADGLLIDLRKYPQPGMFNAIVEVLFAEPTPYIQLRIPVVATPDPLVQESIVRWPELLASAANAFSGPVVVLIGGDAISQAETIATLLQDHRGAVMVGEPTAGTNGDIAWIDLPFGLGTWISGVEVRHTDGRPYQGIGTIPDVVVHPTIQGIREGRDEILEKGIEILRALIERAGG